MTTRFKLVAAAAVAVSIATPALGSVMNADEFYQRAMKLKKKGALAMFSGNEIKRLVNEVKVAGETVKKARLAAEAEGKRGRYCPPESKKRLDTDEYLRSLGQIPPVERKRIDLIEATARIMETKFPCRG